MELRIPPRSVAFADRDAMLYAAAVGAGAQGGSSDLEFLYERGLRILPSFANILAFDDSWLAAGGIDLSQVVHGSLDLTFHADPTLSDAALVTSKVSGVVDKGEGRGAIIVQETEIRQGDRPVCTSVSSLFVRGGGGFGGSLGKEPYNVKLPERTPDVTVLVPTARNQAALFRLLGDRNPLHVDPAAARAAGFERPILHGACTFGISCLTIIRSFCEGRPERLARLAARFAGPLVPGQGLQFLFWRDGREIHFKAIAADTLAPVLDGGMAHIRNQEPC